MKAPVAGSVPLLQPWDVYMIRVPLRGVDDRPISSGIAFDGGRSGYLALLKAAWSNTTLRTAVRLASPALARTLERVRPLEDIDGEADGEITVDTRSLRRAALSVLRYDLRMRCRPTPFGLFAGVGVGRYDETAKVDWSVPDQMRVLPDMQWLLALVRRWETHPAVLPGLQVHVTTPLVVRGGRVHLDSPVNLTATGDSQRVAVRVRRTAAVADCLSLAERPMSFVELAQTLAARHGGDVEAASALVRGLVEREILITDLRPPLDGGDPLDHLLGRLSRAAAACSTAGPSHVQDGPLPDVERLREVARRRRAAETATEAADREQELVALTRVARQLFDHETPLHVDVRLGLETRLPHAVAAEAAEAVQLMRQLSPRRLGMRSLRGWHENFVDKYGVGRLVPLVEALDPAAGLGAPGGYEWPPADAHEDTARTAGPAAAGGRPDETGPARARAELVARALRSGAREIVLDDTTLRTLGASAPSAEHTQSSCELYAVLVARSAEALAAGDFRLVVAPNPGSHQGGATFGRFDGLLDAEVRRHLGDLIRDTRTPVPGAMLANLAYQPRSPKAANIAHAPAPTRRRVAVGLPPAIASGVEEVPLHDLAVGATLDRLYLVHVPTGREFVPTAHTMLSPGTQAPNVARFLFEVGLEGQHLWEPWDWGAAGAMPFLPRVRRGRVVLCPATWKLDVLRDVVLGAPGPADDGRFAAAVRAWRSQWAVPDRILVLSSDQRLSLDLDEPWHLMLLADELRRDRDLVAQELPGGEDADGWLRGPDGRARVAELVIPMRRREGLPTVPPAGVTLPVWAPGLVRRRPVGSEWLYLRVDVPYRLGDEVIRDHLPLLIDRARGLGVRSWFFLRYSLPGHHLRIRLRGDPEALVGEVVPALAQTLEDWRDQWLCGSWTIDAYDPEFERYGGPDAQDAVEEVFHHDSECALALLRLTSAAAGPLDRDEVAAVSLAALAHAFGPPSPGDGTPTAVVRDVASPGPAAEWLATTGLPRDIPAAVRSRRARWLELVDPHGGWHGLLAPPGGADVLAALNARDAAVARYGDLIRHLTAAGTCATPQARVVGSLLHMTFNRLVGGSAEHERAVLAAARMAVTGHAERRRRQP